MKTIPRISTLVLGLFALALTPGLIRAQTGRLAVKGVWPGSVARFQVAGGHAHVDTGSELVILDVSDPADPHPIYATAIFGTVLQVAGNHAYLSGSIWTGTNHVPAIDILDVTNPTNPVPAGSFETRLDVSGIQVVGDRAYLTEISEPSGSNAFWGLEI